MSALPPYSAARADVLRLPGGRTERDELAVEEPLEIRVNGEAVAVTMRTPGHDEELSIGFLRSEGIRAVAAQPTADLAANTIDVQVEDDFDPGRLRRNFYTTSSCGVCGKGALEAVAVEAPRVEGDLRVPAAVVGALPDRLRSAQPAFAATGGLHATGLFGADGELIVVREDVGRHNAFDKVVGRAFLDGLLPLADKLVCVSGRLSFELVQKAAVAGAPILVAVGAPSTLAVELARDRGDHALRLRPRRPRQRLLGAVAGGGVTFAVPAEAYDRLVGRYSYALAGALADAAGIEADSSVLDVGAGSGAGTRRLAELVGPGRVAAVEPSAPFVEALRERLPGADVRRASAESLPFEDATFDAALTALVVNFMEDPLTGVAEMRRVTRPGGAVAACVWDYGGEMTLLRAFWDSAVALAPDLAAAADERSRMRFAREGELGGLWQQAGLRDVREGELVVSAGYESFDDLWEPFTLGAGPAGAYAASLDPGRQDALRDDYRRRLAVPHGGFRLSARAWFAVGTP